MPCIVHNSHLLKLALFLKPLIKIGTAYQSMAWKPESVSHFRFWFADHNLLFRTEQQPVNCRAELLGGGREQWVRYIATSARACFCDTNTRVDLIRELSHALQ